MQLGELLSLAGGFNAPALGEQVKDALFGAGDIHLSVVRKVCAARSKGRTHDKSSASQL